MGEQSDVRDYGGKVVCSNGLEGDAGGGYAGDSRVSCPAVKD